MYAFIWKHTSPTSLPKPDIVSLLNICQTDRQKPISNFVILYIRTVFFLSSNVDLVVFSSGEASILCFGEALSFRSIPASSLCPIQLVSALLVIVGLLLYQFFAFPIAEQRRIFFLSLTDSHCICTYRTPRTESQITITDTPQHNLSPSHTYHITYKITFVILSHTPWCLIEGCYSNHNQIRFLTRAETHHFSRTLQILPDDCGLSWVSPSSSQFPSALLIELFHKLFPPCWAHLHSHSTEAAVKKRQELKFLCTDSNIQEMLHICSLTHINMYYFPLNYVTWISKN